jgi:hypothetical protein
VKVGRPLSFVVATLLLLALGGCARRGADERSAGSPAADTSALAPREASLAVAGVHHYEYVFPDQAMYVYDIDHGHRLVEKVSLSGIRGIRGVVVAPQAHVLYISHGGDGGANGNGSLLAYDLLTGRIRWDRVYSSGIDSMAIDPSGNRIYMPDGELATNGTWHVLDARSGQVIGAIEAGQGPHNTIVGLSGEHVYLGGRDYPYLDVADTTTNRTFERIGPFISGVRPFTINGSETLAYTTATAFLGFQVSSIRTGRVIGTVTFGPRFRWNPARFGPSAPSHGISLSPDERQLWVIDAPNSYVHVFDVSRVPASPPHKLADIRLRRSLTGNESGCSYDCARDGWLQHSRSGCFVYVGDSGDVLASSGLRVVAFLPALRETRKMLELDWRAGVPVASTSRSGVGYVSSGPRPPRPKCR